MEFTPHPIGPYFLRKRLHRGSLFEIFEAFDTVQHIRVAIKQVRPECVYDLQVRRLLRSEYEILKTLDHPALVKPLDWSESPDQVFLVLEWISAWTLRELLNALKKKKQHFDYASAFWIFFELLDALSYLHHQVFDFKGKPHPLFHSDLNPKNILIEKESHRLRLIDFSPEQLFENLEGRKQGLGRGAMGYLAPEHMDDAERPDQRSDLFVAGILFYEMLCGKSPFLGKNLVETYINWTQKTLKPDQIHSEMDGELKNIFCRMLALNPADRYPTAAAVKEALSDWAKKHNLVLSNAFSFLGTDS